jgi:multidrug resistance efflux pump
MNRSHQPAAPRHGRVSFFAWLGIFLLAASFVGAGLALHSRASDGSAPAGAPAGAASVGRRAIVFGYVDAPGGLTNLYPVQPGQVDEVLVKEGDAVEPGTPLYRLKDTQAKAKVAQAKAALAEAKSKEKQARAAVVKHKADLQALEKEIEAYREQLAVAKDQLKFEQDQLKTFKDSSKAAKPQVDKAEGQVRQLEKTIEAKEKSLEGARAIDPSANVEEAEAAVQRYQALLDEAEFGLRECTVTAKAKGTILQLNVTPGELIGSTPLGPTQNPRHPVVFCPAGPRIIRAEVNQEWANRAAVGQPALIQDDSSATASWRGHVTYLSDWYTHRRSTVLEPLQFNDVRTMEAIIEVEPNQPPLRIGQRMLVTLEGAN